VQQVTPAAAALFTVAAIAAVASPTDSEGIASPPNSEGIDGAALASDPWFRPLGPELYPDADPTHYMSHTRIDPTLTHFDAPMMKTVQELWKRLAYDNKKMAGVFPDDPHVDGPYYGVREVHTRSITTMH
jgi:hypothetical protein